MTDTLTVYEMGPRDGLQNEPTPIATADKIRLIDLLSATGLSRIEAASFVSPRWVPQMGDAAQVMAGITRAPGVRYGALTPNLRGYQGARAAQADEVAVFASASETFSQRNINCSIAESLERFAPVLQAARSDGIPVRGYVSCVVVCPYEGAIAPAAAARVTEALLAMGCHQVSLGDTVGRGTPQTIAAMLDAVLAVAPPGQLAAHYHDTGGQAVANLEVSLARGLRVVDAAVAGLGGCPYAPGALGNVATEAVLDLADRLGLAHGVDRARLATAAAFIRGLVRSPADAATPQGPT